jgi:hypothetical protein
MKTLKPRRKIFMRESHLMSYNKGNFLIVTRWINEALEKYKNEKAFRLRREKEQNKKYNTIGTSASSLIHYIKLGVEWSDIEKFDQFTWYVLQVRKAIKEALKELEGDRNLLIKDYDEKTRKLIYDLSKQHEQKIEEIHQERFKFINMLYGDF